MALQRVDTLGYHDVFSYSNLYKSMLKSKKGVLWKTSTKKFFLSFTSNLSSMYLDLKYFKYKSKKIKPFPLHDRGKSRIINPLHIRDRTVQKCFCMIYLNPLLTSKLIYDSGACMKGKGLSFTMDRLQTHFHKYHRKNSNDGYALTIDFKNYFNSIDHDILLSKVRPQIKDNNLFAFYKTVITKSGLSIGLGLGSEVSQISALYYVASIDHYIKEKLRIKQYARYMDDCYLLSKDKEYLKKCLFDINILSEQLKLKLNLKKCYY